MLGVNDLAWGGYFGYVTVPDGCLWKVASPSEPRSAVAGRLAHLRHRGSDVDAVLASFLLQDALCGARHRSGSTSMTFFPWIEPRRGRGWTGP
jgi:hypothetical protein